MYVCTVKLMEHTIIKLHNSIDQIVMNAELRIVETKLGDLKEIKVTCDKDIADKLIDIATKQGICNERFNGGVTFYK